MKQQVRRGVFETNSSSVHSLTFSKSTLEPSTLTTNGLGEIEVELGNFGKSRREYYDQTTKLSYLLTSIYYIVGQDVRAIYDNEEFDYIVRAVCSYTGANGIKITNSEGYIDHQSIPVGGISIINASNVDEIKGFIFSKDIGIKTDCD